MKLSSTLAGLALLLCAASAGAQMYKWKDAKGVVHFSDQPPPESAAKVEKKSFDGGARDTGLPYALAEAVRRSPVVLYTTDDCTACDQGRALLNLRGVPFVEKTVNTNEDRQKLTEAGSSGQLPLLLVGGAKRIGFEASAWNETLTNAAYPLQRRLPASHRNPAAAPAAPPAPVEEKPLAREAERVPSPKPPSPDTPPGFKF
jgi:glutaredoxin